MIEYCEDQSLEGRRGRARRPVAAGLGLRGIPGVAEAITADATSCCRNDRRLPHRAHERLTTIEAVRQEKSRGVKVTRGLSASLTLTDDLLASPTPTTPTRR